MIKERDIINFVKTQLPFDGDWQHLDVSDRFEVSNFSLFCLFLEIQLDCHRLLPFIGYRLVILLHLESFENNLFALDF